jgi:hypothetical protein
MSDSSDDDRGKEIAALKAASKYRSQVFRDDRQNTNRLDESILGPTKVHALPWSEHLCALLCGVKEDPGGSSLHVLSEHESTILKRIYGMLVDTWKERIILTPPAHAVGRAVPTCIWDMEAINHVFVGVFWPGIKRLGRTEAARPEIAFSLLGLVAFPKPTGRNVSVLPFIMGDEESLPEDLRPYYDSLIAKCPVADEEYGKVMYLTISEGLVDESATQRRSGLHVEAAGGIQGIEGKFLAGTESNWGGGVREFYYGADKIAGAFDAYEGGLYMASNMDDTCELFDALVAKGQGLVDYHGSGDHLRLFIGTSTKLKANELAWLTDRTPHQALPQPKKGYRQFFRLVTSNISVWFQQHSTANPKVPIPADVVTITGDKISKAAASSGDQHRPDGETSPAKKAKREA